MTTFNIISIGDVEFLGRILNAVATVCGTGDFKTLCICGFIFGLLFIGFQCIFQGAQRINLQHTLVCFICYMCFFGPSCTVTIEDARGSTYTRVVDNVPIGVGVAGMAISGIGYGVTKLMEQAFGTVDRTENYSYIEPLKILNDLRSAAYSDDIWAAIDNQCGAGCDTRQAVVNYLAECTSKGIQVGVINRSNLRQADFTGNADAFQFVNNAYMTYLPLIESGKLVGTDNDGYVTCAEGWSKVKTHVLNKIPTAAVATRLNGMLNIKEFSEDGTSKAVSTDWSKISDSFQMLGLTANRAQDFMKAAVVDSVMNEANAQFLKSQHDVSTAIMINQAIVQRDTQWASEQSMFVSASRGFMAFFEGFVYAVTPLMGFFFMVGAFGLSLVGKYFMVLAWIQLWLPCMSICNLYTMTGARSAMSVANNYGASIYALDTIYNNVSHWVAVGGVLFAATPVLALFMISGSMYAFTTLTNRMQGRDHFNEKGIAPDVQQVGALQSTAPVTQNDRTFGVRDTRFETQASSFTVGQGLSLVKSHRESLANEATSSTSAAVSEMMKNGTSFSTQNQYAEAFGQQWQDQLVTSNQTARQWAGMDSEGGIFTSSQQTQLMGAIGATLRAGASGGYGFSFGMNTLDEDGNRLSNSEIANRKGAIEKIANRFGLTSNFRSNADGSVGVTLTAQASSTDSTSGGIQHGKQFNSSDNSSQTKSKLSNLSQSLNAAQRNISSDTWNQLASAEKNKTLSDSYSKSARMTKAVETVSGLQQSAGVNQSINSIALQHSLHNSDAMKFVNRTVNAMTEKDKQHFNEEMDKFIERHMDSESARLNAAINYFGAGYGDEQSRAEFGALLEKSSLPILGMNLSQLDVGQMDKPGDVENRFDKVRGDIKGQEGSINAQNPGKVHYEGGKAAVRGSNAMNQPTIDRQFRENRASTMKQTREETLANLANSPIQGDAMKLVSFFKDGPLNGQPGITDRISDMLFGKDNAPTKDATGNFKPNVQNWKEWQADYNNQKKLSGFTDTQVSVIEAMHNMQYAKATFNSEEYQKARIELDNASNALWNEMKQTLIGDRNLEHGKDDGDIQKVSEASAHMLSQLRDVFVQQNEGTGTMIKQFNTAYDLTGPMKSK